MSDLSPVVYLVRHGETAWSVSGQHTGLTDLPLTENGEREAQTLSGRLASLSVAKVLTSPLLRARQTCTLAGFGGIAEDDRNLLEWDYGDYEGLRSSEIHVRQPNWQIFQNGCPGGESPTQVAARADHVLARSRAIKGDVLIFSSGHFLRMLVARWLLLEPSAGKFFALDTASISELGYEKGSSQPVIRLWNDNHHLIR